MKLRLFKFFACFALSILVFLSFKVSLIYKGSIEIIFSFILVQISIWSLLFFEGKKSSIISYNLYFIIVLNLFTTPIFHLITFDIPYRAPNYVETKTYSGKFFEGIFFGEHTISADEKGFRINKDKINYYSKNKNTFRVFNIGASTTEQMHLDDKKIWTNLLGNKIKKITDKDIEIINTGVGGLRAEHHYIFQKRIKKYNPDLLIFLIGINDWNHHIKNSEVKFFFPKYEIKYDFKKSILFNFFQNINKQLKKKISPSAEKNIQINEEEYYTSQINSLNIRETIKKFKPNSVSEEYKFWLNLTINECKENNYNCLFLDQPNAYDKNVSTELKNRFWMTPPNEDYTLNLEDLIYISSLYNNFLKNITSENKLNFCNLSNKIKPNINYFYDDCHFSEKGSKKVSEIVFECLNMDLKLISN